MIVILAFGTTAPLESDTVPVMRPVLAWPNRLSAHGRTKKRAEVIVFTRSLMVSLLPGLETCLLFCRDLRRERGASRTKGLEPARLLSNCDFRGEPLNRRRPENTIYSASVFQDPRHIFAIGDRPPMTQDEYVATLALAGVYDVLHEGCGFLERHRALCADRTLRG